MALLVVGGVVFAHGQRRVVGAAGDVGGDRGVCAGRVDRIDAEVVQRLRHCCDDGSGLVGRS